jgi:hypothetical protein
VIRSASCCTSYLRTILPIRTMLGLEFGLLETVSFDQVALGDLTRETQCWELLVRQNYGWIGTYTQAAEQ